MRMHTNGGLARKGRAVAAVTIVAAVLSGCGTASMFGGSDITGSTSSSSMGSLSQPMPAPVTPIQNQSQGRYTPPNPVGAQSFPSASAANLQAPLPGSTVSSSALPPLVSTPPASNPMSAQAASQLQAPPAAPAPSSAPNLNVVPADAFSHTIQAGESLYSIARKYAVTTDSIVRANKLPSPDKIFVGQRVIIPGRPDLATAERGRIATSQGATIQPATPPKPTPAPVQQAAPAPVPTPAEPQTTASVSPTPAPVQQAAPAAQPMPAMPQATSTGFRWPVQGRMIADFKASKGTGINIEAPEGAAIRAAGDGQVIYTGDGVEGYGNLVLIRHANGYVSAYAHLKDINVAKGDSVNRGDSVGTAGMTGGVSRPQLHFELRNGSVPVDPVPLFAS